jgi:serine/threonine protein phosphatase PrpC
MGNVLDGAADHVTDKTTEIGSNSAGDIQYAASEMKGLRDTMEDCHTLCTCIPIHGTDGCLEDHSLFAVYDGHGGSLTSQYAGKRFVRLFSQRSELKKYAALPKNGDKGRDDVTGIGLLRKALRDTFLALDDELRNLQLATNESLFRKLSSGTLQPDSATNTSMRPERSGSTIVVVLITPSHILCANAGDSRAILQKGSKVFSLSFDHKPSNVAELERIVSAGGFVRGKRVDGDLAVSRGLGDFFFKIEEGLPPDKQRVIAEPDFMVYPRDKDEFIVLACDGKLVIQLVCIIHSFKLNLTLSFFTRCMGCRLKRRLCCNDSRAPRRRRN